MSLHRLVLEFTRDGIRLRVLYKRKDGPDPGTVACRREVRALSVEELTAALQALEGDVDDIDTSEFAMREATILCKIESEKAVTYIRNERPRRKEQET